MAPFSRVGEGLISGSSARETQGPGRYAKEANWGIEKRDEVPSQTKRYRWKQTQYLEDTLGFPFRVKTYLGLEPIFDGELISQIMETGESRTNETPTQGVSDKLPLRMRNRGYLWIAASAISDVTLFGWEFQYLALLDRKKARQILHQNSMHPQSATRRYRFQSSLQGLDRCTNPRDDLTHDPRPAKSKDPQAQTEL